MKLAAPADLHSWIAAIGNVQFWAAHRSVTTTQRYLHYVPTKSVTNTIDPVADDSDLPFLGDRHQIATNKIQSSKQIGLTH